MPGWPEYIKSIDMDIVSTSVRSTMMAGIKGKNTKPELIVRKALFAAGFRFRLHRQDLPGAPDIVLPGRKVAVFVHGCFWHRHAGCRFAKLPSSNKEFWKTKLDGNRKRDRKSINSLLALGWRVHIVWECATRDPIVTASLGAILAEWIGRGELLGDTASLRVNADH
jgi:DNA mismatch endonuclease (patch repair protein)